MLNNPSNIAKGFLNFANVAKFRQIWSLWISCRSRISIKTFDTNQRRCRCRHSHHYVHFWDQFYKTIFACNWSAVILQHDFDALFKALNGFTFVILHHQDGSVLILSSKHKYVHLKTHWASHTMHQNLAVILGLFNYDKNSFIVLIPSCKAMSHQIETFIPTN